MNTPQAYHPAGYRRIPESYESYPQPVSSKPTQERAALGVDRLPKRVPRAGLNTTFTKIEPARVGNLNTTFNGQHLGSLARNESALVISTMPKRMQKIGREASDSQRPITPTLNSITGGRRAGTQSSYGRESGWRLQRRT
ncbi:hypothetical protein FVER53263_20898 [Fusarium verticillioides]|nr:hypothetical protein FVER53263_20898 [Fusarium verticillioides]